MGNKAQSRKETSAKDDTKNEVVVPPDHAFKIEITGQEGKDESHTAYLIKVTTWPNQQLSFNIKDRYSVLRSFQEDIVKKLFKDTSTLPPFPEKKFFGGNDPKFLQQRKEQLVVFFNEFFVNERVLTHSRAQILEYFMESAAEDVDRIKIQRLIEQHNKGLVNIPSSDNQVKAAASTQQIVIDGSDGATIPIVRKIDILKEGWVYKQSRQIKQWKERWLVVTKNHALTYKKPNEYNNTDPTEVIALSSLMGCGMDEEVKYKGSASFVMENPQDQFNMCAKDSNENKEWVRVISLEIDLAKKRNNK